MGCGKSTDAVDNSKESKKPAKAPPSPRSSKSQKANEVEDRREEPDLSVLREMYDDKEAFDRMSQGRSSAASSSGAPIMAPPTNTANATDVTPTTARATNTDATTPNGNSSADKSPFRLLTADQNGNVTVLPSIGFVVKTKDLKNDEKIFVNVMTFPYLQTKQMVVIPCQESTDKKGQKSKSYGVVVSAEELEKCRESPEMTHQLSETVVRFINSASLSRSVGYSDDKIVQLDALNVKVPKIKRGYVGEECIAEIQVPALKIMNGYWQKNKSSSNNTSDTTNAPVTATVTVPATRTAATAPTSSAPSVSYPTPVTAVTAAPSSAPSVAVAAAAAAPVTTSSTTTTIATSTAVAAASSVVPVVAENTNDPNTTTTNSNNSNNNVNNININAPTVDVTVAAAEAVAPGATEAADSDDEEGVDGNANLSALVAPKMMKGFLKKQGHAVLNWKTRFFVLDNGYCTYFVDESLSPPYGKNMKGHFCLAGYRRSVLDLSKEQDLKFEIRKNSALGFDGVEAAGDKLKRRTSTSVEGGDVEYMLLDANNASEKEEWADAFLAHALYIEAVIRHDMSALALAEAEALALAGQAPTGMGVGVGEATNSIISSPGVSMSGAGAGADGGTSSIISPGASESSIGSTSTSRNNSMKSRSRSIGGGPNDNRQWKVFLRPEESIILSGPLFKPNPVGVKHVRQLILTNTPRIVYIDPAKLETKGEIYWKKKEDVTVKLIDDNTFEVAVRTMSRTFKFLSTTPGDSNSEFPSCEEWVTAINANAEYSTRLF